MPYIQEGRYVIWIDPPRRGVGLDGQPVRLGRERPVEARSLDSEEPPDDPDGVRDTTVKGPESPWLDPPHCRLTARKR